MIMIIKVLKKTNIIVMMIKKIKIKIILVNIIMNSIEQKKKIMLMNVGVENYINNYEQGGM